MPRLGCRPLLSRLLVTRTKFNLPSPYLNQNLIAGIGELYYPIQIIVKMP